MKKLKQLLTITALIFTGLNTSAQWTQQGLDINGETAGDWSGSSVSMSSDGLTVAIGAERNAGNGTDAGHVRVYQFISGVWAQLGLDIDGEANLDQSGSSVSMSSDGLTIAIGVQQNSDNGVNSGHVRVYQFISGVWTQLGADIDGETALDRSGKSVSMSADGLTVAIGAHRTGTAVGHVRVYQFISGVWTQLGADIDGETAGDNSGWSVSMDADGLTVAIGAYLNDGNGISAGHVRVYQFISGIWVQLGADIDGEATGDRSGHSVSISADGLTVAIGARENDDNGIAAGHVRVYQFISGMWTQLGTDIDGEVTGDRSGYSVSISSDGLTVAIGAYFNDGNGTNAGHVRVHQFISGVWVQLGADIDGEAAGDQSGYSVSVSSDGLTVAIGALFNDGAGHVRVYSTLPTSTPEILLKDLEVQLYPNPIQNTFTIEWDKVSTNVQISIRSIDGKVVYSNSSSNTNKQIIDAANWSKGFYVVNISNNQYKKTVKLVR